MPPDRDSGSQGRKTKRVAVKVGHFLWTARETLPGRPSGSLTDRRFAHLSFTVRSRVEQRGFAPLLAACVLPPEFVDGDADAGGQLRLGRFGLLVGGPGVLAVVLEVWGEEA